MTGDLNQVIDAVVKERGVSRDVIVEALEAAMLTAARKKLGLDYDIEAQFNQALGEVELFRFREVTDDVEDEATQILIEEAKKLDPDVQIGDSLGEKVDSKGFGRISAQMAKQVIIQKVRDAEKENIYNEYKDRKHDIANGIVRRFEKGNMVVDLGRAEAIMYHRDQIPRENYAVGDRIRAYISDVIRSTTAPQIQLSRSHPDFLKKLFELEVPEIAEGVVSIVAAAREPGMRAKIAVSSRDPNVDPVGACVGMKGSRVQSVVNELRGEKIDIVPYSENPARFVCNALAPAEVTKVIIDEDAQAMQIIVPDDQLSLAIGKRGQNVRLAVQLTGWKLDIQSETKWTEISEIARSMFARIPQIPNLSVDLLIKSGYMDVEEIADAKIEDLARFPGIDDNRAKEIIEVANHILDTNEWPLPEPEPVLTPEQQAKAEAEKLFGKPAADAAASEGEAGESDSGEEESGSTEAEAAPTVSEAVPAAGANGDEIRPELLLDLMKLDGVGLKSAQALYNAGYRNRDALKGVRMDDLLAVPGLDLEIAQKVADSMKG
ncbi:MAG: transcription termination/antitermination protein NusA [Deltaproteobacteria bacterium]|nr:transcription termination/antitermination protein NusA [Deltaproteobacteria bacterium]MCB9479070.1 transcription termination/antitermination protein NusA [Deltaproteobacteria bacterium]MCB9488132.1 transcription termination/antitermination protein NusA [Deltaproteobacteria bacterium]